MSMATASIAGSEALLAQARTLLKYALPAHLRKFESLLPSDPYAYRETRACSLPVLRWLSEMPDLTTDPTRDIVVALKATAPKLSWGQTYSNADMPAQFLARYGWHEIVGQRGPIASDQIALGVLLLGPETVYPRHQHAAEEVYLVLAGAADWQRDDGPFRRLPPGALIHHPSQAWHAMRTGVDPLLTLYAWCGGDLTQKSHLT